MCKWTNFLNTNQRRKMIFVWIIALSIPRRLAEKLFYFSIFQSLLQFGPRTFQTGIKKIHSTGNSYRWRRLKYLFQRHHAIFRFNLIVVIVVVVVTFYDFRLTLLITLWQFMTLIYFVHNNYTDTRIIRNNHYDVVEQQRGEKKYVSYIAIHIAQRFLFVCLFNANT